MPHGPSALAGRLDRALASRGAKKAIKRNANGDRVNSFAGLIDHLGTMTRNTMRMPLAAKHPFTLLSKSTPLQDAAFKLLASIRSVSSNRKGQP